jgi:hypothetical protein
VDGGTARSGASTVRGRVIDPDVPQFLRGAWDDLERDGPAAASKAAHCIVETLDHTLRAAAPEDAVRARHAASGRSSKEWEGQGKPPRSLRVKFLAQRAGDASKVAIQQYESLATLVSPLHGRLQGVKHASAGDVALVRNLLWTTKRSWGCCSRMTRPDPGRTNSGDGEYMGRARLAAAARDRGIL